MNELDRAIVGFADATPENRIAYRDAVLAFGAPAVAPLVQAATDQPKLVASVSAWLEHLATTQPDCRRDAEAGLRRIAELPDGNLAKAALARLAPLRKASGTNTPAHRGKSAACEAVHARLIEFARQGRTVYYSELDTSRGHIGKYLYQISRDEAAAVAAAPDVDRRPEADRQAWGWISPGHDRSRVRTTRRGRRRRLATRQGRGVRVLERGLTDAYVADGS